MPLSRRQFLASLATSAAAGLLAPLTGAAAGEARVISWPSRVVPLPPDGDDHKPPVVTAVRLHQGGQWLATAGDDHLVRVWNLADGKLVHKLNAHTDWVRAIDYSPDGRVLASAGNDRQIIFWDTATGARREIFALHDAAIAAIRFSHDGKLLAAVGFEESVRLYDVATKQVIARPPAPCQDIRAVTFSPDDQLLAIGGRCGSIRLLSVPRGELVRDFPAHRQRIRALAFSSDGAFVASSGEDRLIHVAPVAGTEGYSLPPRPAKALSLVFYGPQQLAVAGSDNIIRLWDVASKDEIGCLRGHTGSVAALECQGKILVSAGFDTTVRIWDVGDQMVGPAGPGPGRVGIRPTESDPRAR
jgi:WD40 repeat protein